MEISQKSDGDSGAYESEFDISVNTMSSGCDASMEHGFDISREDFRSSSPIPKLNITAISDGSSPEHVNENIRNGDCGSVRQNSLSPPYKRVRALRLFDSPATPKTLLETCSLIHTPAASMPRSRLFSRIEKDKGVPSAYLKVEKPSANVNPFTPNGMLLLSKKRSRSKRSLVGSPCDMTDVPNFELNDSDDSDPEVEQPTKRLALRESNIPRYRKEFLEVRLIGTGEFGSVYECINRLDGCTYAVKKSIKPVAGSVNETTALNEVYAHAVLGRHQHVVRYYSAWAEDNHMIIQNEFCNGGSLADAIEQRQSDKRPFTEPELKRLLLHVAEGLRYIHSMQLVHMDIKPGNIFISREKRLQILNYDSADDGFEEDDPISNEEEITYKIGDLGHVTSVSNPQVEEGDCRYLPCEILQEDFTNLTKADIFALGLTIYEAGGGGPLPKNGEEWHSIREGKLKELPLYSRDFNELMKQMVHPNPEMRPSAVSLIQHRVLCPFGNKSKAQLRRELNAEKLKNELLAKQLENAEKCFKSLPTNVIQQFSGSSSDCSESKRSVCTRSSRLIGKKVYRRKHVKD
ncbi:wee1-like protein kinase isoform X2 [Periplaneta americana]|uniref:wee1-like protein kinase isoform X2 n=1 Tax=Periplaneta americana TaxID=6978 RepID=UPI0037E7D6D6